MCYFKETLRLDEKTKVLRHAYDPAEHVVWQKKKRYMYGIITLLLATQTCVELLLRHLMVYILRRCKLFSPGVTRCIYSGDARGHRLTGLLVLIPFGLFCPCAWEHALIDRTKESEDTRFHLEWPSRIAPDASEATKYRKAGPTVLQRLFNVRDVERKHLATRGIRITAHAFCGRA